MITKAVWVPKVVRKAGVPKAEPLTSEQIAELKRVRKERAADRLRRSMESRRRAWNLLAEAHPIEFASLLADMTEQVDVERGDLLPLPTFGEDN